MGLVFWLGGRAGGLTMPRQNRIMPTGEVVVHPARGLFMGNRGILHDGAGQLGRARWRHPHWITCQIAFRGRTRPLMAPGAYTELFFLDEAVACAAGHRPCAECRRAEYRAYAAAWADVFGQTNAAGIDRALHAARIDGRGQRRHTAPAQGLPDGVMVLIADQPHLIRSGRALPFAPDGYGPPVALPHGDVTVLTPAPSVAVMAAGWQPALHPSAG
jgi:hypothetical protein